MWASDLKYRALREEAGASFYLPNGQSEVSAGVIHVRTNGSPLVLPEALRQSLSEVDLGAGEGRTNGAREARLFGIPAGADLPTLLISAGILAGAGVLAAWGPARRAGSLDPAEALGAD